MSRVDSDLGPDLGPDPGPDLGTVLSAVGPRLRTLRRQRDITLSALAQSTGISVSTLSRLENGQRKPTLEQLLPSTDAVNKRMACRTHEERFNPLIAGSDFVVKRSEQALGSEKEAV